MGKRGSVSGSATKRELELERENEWLKRQLAKAKGRLRKVREPLSDEEEPESVASDPVRGKGFECPKCKGNAERKSFGPKEFWTCGPCKWVQIIPKGQGTL